MAPSFNTDIQVRSIFGSDCSELLVFYCICTVFSVFSTTLKSKKLQQHSVHNIGCTLFVKPFRVRQNAPFCKKKLQNFLGRGHSPLPRPHSRWGGGPHTPPPRGLRPLDLDPPALKTWRRPWTSAHGGTTVCVWDA